jgi:hypothetical protein
LRRSFMLYWFSLGVLYLASAMYAGLILTSTAKFCTPGCPARDLSSPSLGRDNDICEQLQAPGSTAPLGELGTATTAQLLDAYNAGCLVCRANSNAMVWPCANTVRNTLCNNTGAFLTPSSCDSLVVSTKSSATVLSQLQVTYGSAAKGACVQFIGTEVAEPGYSNATIAEEGIGPGKVVILSQPFQAPTVAPKAACSSEDLLNFLEYGEMCFNVPSSYSLRGLLQPGLIGFALSFFAQFVCASVAGFGLCFFRR